MIVGVGADSKLAMTTDRAAFTWPIIIRRDDVLTRDAEVTVQSSILSGPSGRVVEPKLTRDGKPLTGPLKLATLAQEPLALTGKADAEGTYTGEITIALGTVRTAVVLTLTRTRPALELKIDPISRLRDTAGSDGVGLQVRMQNPTGIELEVNPPVIAQLDRVDASGAAPVDVGVAGYNVGYVLPNGGKPDQPMHVAADGALDFKVVIRGLSEAGNYKGAMRFTAPDRQPVDLPFDMALRIWWVWPALTIAAGTIIAALLRYYQQSAQPRLLLQRDALNLRSKLTGLVQTEANDLVTHERQAIASLIEQLDEASDNLAANEQIEGAKSAIALVRQKWPLLSPWITARRRHDGLQPPSVAATIETDLDTVFTTLTNPDATTQMITDATNLLAGIEAKIRDGIRAYILATVASTTEAIDPLPDAEKLAYAPVTQELATAEAEANALHLDLASAALNRARSGFAVTAARLLSARLDPRVPAIGFTAPDWRSLVTDIKGMLDAVAAEPDPEQQVRRWNDANRLYLTQVVQRAKTRIDTLVQANINQAHAALTAAANQLALALGAVARGDLAAARTAYDGAIATATQVRQAIAAAGSQLGEAAGADTPAPPAGAAVPASVLDTTIGTLLPLPLGRGVDINAFKRQQAILNFAFSFVIVVLAVLSGLQLLYVPNAAFGSNDLLVAFLWGAGLHAVAGQAFQGLQSLATQVA